MKQLLIILSIILISCQIKDNSKKVLSDSVFSGARHIDSVFVRQCEYIDLSRTFDFKLDYKKVMVKGENDSSIISIKILDKKTHLISDSIFYTTIYLIDPIFKDCDSVRSYITDKNTKLEVVDNCFGDFIVADFNFDSKDDIAVVNDYGGNGGPCYNFYIQHENQTFCLDTFLTNEMRRFPTEFNSRNHSLTTIIHASAYSLAKTTYRLQGNKKWKVIDERLIK